MSAENTGKPCVLERGHVAAPSVDHEAGHAARFGAGGEHLTPVAVLGRIGGVDDQHRARRVALGDGHVNGEVVGAAALGGDRGPGDRRALPRRLDAVVHAQRTRLTERGGAEREQIGGDAGGQCSV